MRSKFLKIAAQIYTIVKTKGSNTLKIKRERPRESAMDFADQEIPYNNGCPNKNMHPLQSCTYERTRFIKHFIEYKL